VSWPAQARTSPVDRWLRELRRAVAWRRRLLSAGLAAGSIAFALQALAPPPPAGTDVVVAARDLAAGAVVSTGDLRVAHRPAGDVPSGALTSTAAATGRPVSSAVRRGEVLTDVRLVGPAALRGLADGTVAAPVRVVDAESAALLRPGDVVDLLAASATPDAPTGEARLVASGVRVLLAPRQQRSSLTAGLGNGALLLVATSSSTAARLAAAAVTDRLSVVLRGP
jgi:Flp pilus assembly protein CpaB